MCTTLYMNLLRNIAPTSFISQVVLKNEPIMTRVIDAYLAYASLTAGAAPSAEYPGKFFLASDRETGVLHVGYDETDGGPVSEKFAAYSRANDLAPMRGGPGEISAAAPSKRYRRQLLGIERCFACSF